jgi:3alpha(or 20beta)-hydroxysteroid dehydrogenase
VSTRSRFNGQVVLVTGAARGQGLTEARLFAGEGARVVLADVLVEEGRGAARELGSQAVFVEHDVTSESSWHSLLALIDERLGRLDVVVNNAAIHRHSAILDESVAEVRRVLDVNLIGAFMGVQLPAPLIRRSGGGAIVNIGSIAGWTALANQAAYGMAKWALRGLTKYAALELGPWGIRVTCVLPGRVDSPMLPRSVVEARDKGEVGSRIATTEELAQVVLFLASADAAAITGIDVIVDGGATITISQAPLRDERVGSAASRS